VALICLLTRPRQAGPESDTRSTVLLLLSVWLGYGAIDIFFKQLSKSGAAFSSSLFVAFTLAGVLIFLYLIATRSVWAKRNIIAGLVLGALNFGNIFFYIRAHQVFPQNPTLVFSAMNIGVISLGTLVGAGLFKEKLLWTNVLGIALAITAIVVLIPK
jgi:drug/metabolite transporter (DMT)-like permease